MAGEIPGATAAHGQAGEGTHVMSARAEPAPEAAAGATAAESEPTQEEPGRMPAADRRTWWFRGLIVLLGVLFAGLLAVGVVELRRNGVPVWAVFLMIGFLAILCSVQLVGMALGYGWDDSGPEAGTAVPAEVQKSGVWRVGLVVWMAINVLATVAAISAAIGGDWGNFVDFGGGAILSWIGFGIAARGKVPSRDFRL